VAGVLARGWSPVGCPGCSWSPPMPTPGLVAAIGAALPGASWQRCRSHELRNLLTKVPKSAQPQVATQVRTLVDQADAAAVHARFDRVVSALADHYPEAAPHLQAPREDLLAFTAYPRELWRQIWSNNPQERLNKEIRRRTDVVGIFPSRSSLIPVDRCPLSRTARRIDRRSPLHEPRAAHQKQNPHRHGRTHPSPHHTSGDNRNTDHLKLQKENGSHRASHTPAPRT
jgi:transposase-like protein